MKETIGTVYYDGQCPLCSKEISHLQSQTCALEFIDAHKGQNLPIDKTTLLKQLHVVTPEGKTLIGLDANIYMWRNSRSHWLARFFSLPIVYPVAKTVYAAWAKHRYNKLYGKN